MDHILVRDLPPASGIQYYGLTRMAKYEVAALRLEASTVRRLASLARRTGIPKTVLARRMLERAVDEMWALLGDQKEDGQ